METSFLTRHPNIKDAFSVAGFIICVIAGTLFINNFVFRSFRVVGPSMEPTLYTDQRLIVNRLPVTWSQIQNKAYIPERGEIIVFKNPNKSNSEGGDDHIVKRVIGLPGERVTIKKGQLTVFNKEHPKGYVYDNDFPDKPIKPSESEINTVVPDDQLFVAGDHREGNYSFDSRSGMGTIPTYDVVGPVGVRFFPFDQIRFF